MDVQRFELRGTLGTGGAGTVYRAYDKQLQREVALKLLRNAAGRDLYRFKREFRALADIVHPNLVTLHELHATDTDWYFTMELVEGVSFIDWVRPPRGAVGPMRRRQDILDSPVHEVRLRGALVQLADALIALHKAGKLHRDLKPSNVLVTPQGRLALLDFGLVSSVAENNPEKLAVGTPVYMSPEQAADQPLSEPSDWYSVGAMLYEALVGRRPFEGESEQVMRRKQTELPPSPLSVQAGVPSDLAQLAMQMLQPSPRSRPTGLAILDQLGAAPSPRTRAMARSAMPATFVGRRKELDELRRALSDSRRRGVAVMVRGKSGMGKSALVRTFLRSLTEQAFVLEGRCFEREQVPFKMLDGVVDVLTGVILALPPADLDTIVPKDLAALVRLFPVMRRVKRFADVPAAEDDDRGELRRRGFAALRALIGKLARIRPLVVFVDDAHWGDADSAAFFSDLIHHSEAQTLVLLAHRPEDYLGVVAKLRHPQSGLRRGELREIEVGALPDDEAAILVGQLASDARRVEAAVKAAGGNPLLLTEMARAQKLDAGAKVEDLVAARAGRLSPEAQAMLAVSSIAARPLPIEVAARAAGVVGGHDEALQLTAERLATLRRVGDRMILAPAHDHVRQAVVKSLDVEARAAWHEALARAFEDGEGELDPQAVVEHWIAAGHPANAAHHAVAAGERAEEALAFRRAAELYEIALDYGPWDAAGQRDLLRKQATALACAGQLDEAANIYGHAAHVLPDDEGIDCERLRVETLLRRGRLDEALPAADRLLGMIGVRSPLSATRTRLTGWMQQKLRGLDFVERDATQCRPADLRRIDILYSIVSGLAFADPALGRVLQTELMRVAFDCGEPLRVCLALAQEVCYAAASGSRNAPAVAALGARLQALADRLGDPLLIGLAKTSIGIAAYMSGGWATARTALEGGLATLRDHGAGARWQIDIGESYWLSSLYYLGEWRDMIRHANLLLRDAIERNDVVAQLGVQTGRCNLAWLIAGRPDEARAQLDAAIASLPPGFHLPHVLAGQAACNIAFYLGDVRGAARLLDEMWPNIEKLGVLRMQQLRVELHYLRARVLVAERNDKQLRLLGEDLIKEAAPWAIAIGLIARAMALEIRGDRGGAIVSLHAAEEQLAAAGMTGWLHIARMRRATVEGGPGGAARAQAARDFLRDLGAADPDRLAELLVPWPA